MTTIMSSVNRDRLISSFQVCMPFISFRVLLSWPEVGARPPLSRRGGQTFWLRILAGGTGLSPRTIMQAVGGADSVLSTKMIHWQNLFMTNKHCLVKFW